MQALRPYQEEALQAILAARARGVQRAVLVASVGSGKTTVFTALIRALREGGNTREALIVAHREELLAQAAERTRQNCPGLRVAIEQGPQQVEEGAADVVVASVQTIGRKGTARLGWLRPGLVIVDEMHHAIPGSSYERVLDRFGETAFTLGVTGTMKRLDRVSLHRAANGQAMGGLWEEVVYEYPIRRAIEEGYLCPLRGYRVQTDVDLSGVGTTAGDFNQAELAAAVVAEARTERAVDHWFDVAEGRQTIAFGVNVAHAHQIAETFKARGVPAEAVDGTMDSDKRAAIMDRYRRGETLVLANCMIVTEGADFPETACILMLRPTQSWSLFSQMAGRGLRLKTGGGDCVVIDVVDLTTRHDLATVPAILDLPAGLDLEGRTLSEAAKGLDELGAAAGFLKDYAPKTFSELQTVLRQIDLFRCVEPAPEVRRVARLAWLSVPGGYYVSCGGADRREARLERDALGNWRLRLSALMAGRREVVEEKHLAAETPPALRAADAAVLGRWPDAQWVAGQHARWRKQPPSEKQTALLTRWGYSEEVIRTMDKGTASGVITQRLAGAGR